MEVEGDQPETPLTLESLLKKLSLGHEEEILELKPKEPITVGKELLNKVFLVLKALVEYF